MKADKLSDLSMQLSVDVLNLVKELRPKKKLSFQIKSAEVPQAFAPILPKANMVIAGPILLQNLKLP